jgi:hypothetical protein
LDEQGARRIRRSDRPEIQSESGSKWKIEKTVWAKEGAAEVDVMEEMVQERPVRVRVPRGKDEGRSGMSSVFHRHREERT